MGSVDFTNDTSRLVIASNTLVGTPLYTAGLDRGDRIISLEGKAVSRPADVDAVVEAHKPGDQVVVVFESRGQQHTAALTLGERGGYEIVPNEKAGRPVTDEMKALRAAWLGGKAKVPPAN